MFYLFNIYLFIILIYCFWLRYETKPGASHMSSESKDYLRMLEKKMQEKITAIGKAIVESDDGNEVDESGSGSASGDRIGNQCLFFNLL